MRTSPDCFPESGDRRIVWNGRDLVYPEQMEACFVPVLMGEYKAPELPDEPVVKTVLDIGAACGGFALWALHRWPGAKVICVEPDPDLVWYLRQNVPEAEVWPYAVGRQKGTSKLHIGPEGHRGYNTLNPSMTGYHHHDGHVVVPTIAADELPMADVLKIDAEGAERAVFSRYRYLRNAWWCIYEWHEERARIPCENALLSSGMTLVSGRTQDRDMGEQTWCRTRARMHRRGPWEWRLPSEP